MNSGLSLMQPAGPSLFFFFPLVHAGIPPLMTGDNLLSLLIFLPLPPIALFIDYREISPCVPLSTKVNMEGHVAHCEYAHTISQILDR